MTYATRAKRKEGFVKRFLFASFYRLQRRVSRTSTPLNTGVFCLRDQRAVDALRSMPERNRYLPGLRAYAGFRQIGITVEREQRFSGEPRVTYAGLAKLAMDAMFAYSTAPL